MKRFSCKRKLVGAKCFFYFRMQIFDELFGII